MSSPSETLSPKDISSETKKFINGALKQAHATNAIKDLTTTGLLLLKNLPSTREAVLEYFSHVFFVTVSKYVRQIESNASVPRPEENIIAEIHGGLSNFINENPEAWAPIISAWSLELLGKLSSDFANRGSLTHNSGINDFLQQWMSCKATRTLIDITAQCLQCLMHSDTESCIKALLDTSVRSPYFDWVVAHVGSCFPNTVITRVLSCGLKDFCAMGYEQNVKNRKLNSIVGILGHLAGSHFHDIRRALLDLLKRSLEEDANTNEDVKMQNLATVPFLLNLTSLSPTLLKAVTTDVLQTLKPDIIPRLALYAPEWCKYFNNKPEALINYTVHLILGCEQGASHIIGVLLDTSLSTSNVGYHSINVAKSVKNVCREILELTLQEIGLTLRSDCSQRINIALLNSIKQDLPTVMPWLLNANPLRVQTAVRLLSFLGEQSPNILIFAASFMLKEAKTNFHLAALVRLIFDNAIVSSSSKFKAENVLNGHGYFAQVVEQALREIHYTNNVNYAEARQLFQNLCVLLKWENTEKVAMLRSKFVTPAIKSNLQQISYLLMKTDEVGLAHDIARLLDSLNSLDKDHYILSVEITLKLTRAIVRYFFMCIGEEDVITKQRGIKIVCRLLRVLTCYSSCARVLAVRELLENSLYSNSAKCFGAKEKFEPEIENTLLLHQNHRQGTSTMLAQRHSSVFHAGVIGHGPRKLPPENKHDEETVTLNSMLLVDVIKACCCNLTVVQYPVNLEAMRMFSLLLVQLVSPDVMYNGLPWPDEEFTRVTVERDLQIRRRFRDVPLLWTLLKLTAWYRPALAYCSVLLRAIAATVMANWNLAEGVKLANIMALGQLLPPPLTSIRDILSQLEPHQINTVMRECIWAYMHENVPSPTLFIQNEEATVVWRDTDTSIPNVRFTETLRLVLLANINTLGALYSSLFYVEQK